MSRFRPVRFIGVTVGTLVILAVGVYGPATLLGPLPAVTATLVTPNAAAANPSPPSLPKLGASAVIAQADAASPTGAPLATGGATEALPMASAAKIVTALVVLDAKPLTVGQAGPKVAISTADYQSYIDYAKSQARTVVVFPAEKWTELELLQAMILGSSNNHADTLARWAYGSVDAYLVAANAWLTTNGLTGTHLADATGLHDSSVGTATDLARLAGLAEANPVVADVLAKPASALVGERGVENTTAYLPAAGITGISRSYTDAAGVCFLFTARVPIGDSSFSFAGAFIGEPDYDTLTKDLTALMKSARAGVSDLPILAKGDAYARFEAPWGDTASGIVRVAKARPAWQALVPGDATVKLDTFSTRRSGAIVGRVAVDAPSGTVSSPLVLDRAINDPGLGWRLLHPAAMIAALIASLK
jgi:D-alanyl-D-alanine carboxypeptidase (penicillin-binding protein 5/6)